MIIKKDEVASDFLKLFGKDLLDSIKQRIRERMHVVGVELPIETEAENRKIVKVGQHRFIGLMHTSY